MKRRMLCFAVAAFGLSAGAASADPVRLAQAVPALLPAHEIATIVRSAGFVPLSPAVRRGERYVLRATARDGREMRVIVDARGGGIVSAVPVPAEVAMPGEKLGPYERMAAPGYIPPLEPPPGVHQSGPPVVYEGDRPLIYDRRPLEPVPPAPPSRGTRLGAREPGPELVEPPPIMRDEGTLPPPPERFPQRAMPGPAQKPAAKPAAKPGDSPAEKPAPVKRAAAPPSATPLPKPKPAADPGPATGAKPAEAVPAAAQAAPAESPQGKIDPRSLPH